MTEEELAQRKRIEEISPDLKTLRYFCNFVLVTSPIFVLLTIIYL